MVNSLTNREHEVLNLIAAGHTTKEIAFQLGITFKTAACHRSRIMDKLGAHNTAQLICAGIRDGLINPAPAEPIQRQSVSG